MYKKKSIIILYVHIARVLTADVDVGLENLLLR